MAKSACVGRSGGALFATGVSCVGIVAVVDAEVDSWFRRFVVVVEDGDGGGDVVPAQDALLFLFWCFACLPFVARDPPPFLELGVLDGVSVAFAKDDISVSI